MAATASQSNLAGLPRRLVQDGIVSEEQLQEAIDCYQQAIILWPNDGIFRWRLGLVLEKQKKIMTTKGTRKILGLLNFYIPVSLQIIRNQSD